MNEYYKRACLYGGIFLFLFSLFVFIYTLHSDLFSLTMVLKLSLIALLLCLGLPFLLARSKWAWIAWGILVIILGLFLGRIFIVNENLESLQPAYSTKTRLLSLYAKSNDPTIKKVGFEKSSNEYGIDLYEKSVDSAIDFEEYDTQQALRNALEKDQVQAILLPSTQKIEGLIPINIFGYSISQWQQPSELASLDRQSFTLLIAMPSALEIVQIDPVHKHVLIHPIDEKQRIKTVCLEDMGCQEGENTIETLKKENMGTLETSLEKKFNLRIDYTFVFKENVDFKEWIQTPPYWNPDLDSHTVTTNMRADTIKQLFLLDTRKYSWIDR